MKEHSWFYYEEGLLGENKKGPISESELKQLAFGGKVKTKTKIFSNTRTKGRWVLANQISGVLELIKAGEKARQLERERQKALKEEKANAERKAKLLERESLKAEAEKRSSLVEAELVSERLANKIEFNCRGCDVRLAAPSSKAGEGVGCSNCGQNNVVPSVSQEPLRGSTGSSKRKGRGPKYRRGVHSLYLVRIGTGDEEFIKVGITHHSDPDNRFGIYTKLEGGIHDVHVLAKKHFRTRKRAETAEREFLEDNADRKYTPKTDFSGKSECFNASAERALVKDFNRINEDHTTSKKRKQLGTWQGAVPTHGTTLVTVKNQLFTAKLPCQIGVSFGFFQPKKTGVRSLKSSANIECSVVFGEQRIEVVNVDFNWFKTKDGAPVDISPRLKDKWGINILEAAREDVFYKAQDKLDNEGSKLFKETYKLVKKKYE